MHRYEYGNKDASHLLIQLIDEHNRPMMEKEIDYIQGYYFAKPMPADEFLFFVQSH